MRLLGLATTTRSRTWAALAPPPLDPAPVAPEVKDPNPYD